MRWGVIGTARIARTAFLPAVAAARGGVVTTVAGRDLDRARQYAAENGIGRAVQGYQALLDDPDVDAVYIPLPNALHAEWTARALRAGKAVLCEKPLCGSLAETEQVLAVARETGTPLWEAFVFPFHEQMAKIRGLLADGAIGELREIQSNFAFVLDHPDDFRLRRGMAGGALNDIGCYPVRLAVELFTGELESAWATATLGGDGVDVDLEGSVGYSGHQRLTVSCSFLRSERPVHPAGRHRRADPPHRPLPPGPGRLVHPVRGEQGAAGLRLGRRGAVVYRRDRAHPAGRPGPGGSPAPRGGQLAGHRPGPARAARGRGAGSVRGSGSAGPE